MIKYQLNINRACLVRKISGSLYLLGGSGDTNGAQEYNIAGNSWTAKSDLPFNLEHGACLSAEVKGEYK